MGLIIDYYHFILFFLKNTSLKLLKEGSEGTDQKEWFYIMYQTRKADGVDNRLLSFYFIFLKNALF